MNADQLKAIQAPLTRLDHFFQRRLLRSHGPGRARSRLPRLRFSASRLDETAHRRIADAVLAGLEMAREVLLELSVSLDCDRQVVPTARAHQ